MNDLKGKEYDHIKKSGNEDHLNHLRYRFGYEERDSCVNGFLFPNLGDDFNYYENSLGSGPEFLNNLSLVLDLDLIEEFEKESYYFIYQFNASIGDIIFDDSDDVNKNTLYAMRSYLYRLSIDDESFNPVLRLKDRESLENFNSFPVVFPAD